MQKIKSHTGFIMRWPALMAAAAMLLIELFAMPHSGQADDSLQALDTRDDGSRILNMIAHEKSLGLPEFSFVDRDGNRLSLENFRGKVVALHFWATWCVPCREELPTVDALQGVLGGEDFTFVPLSVDRAGAELVGQYYAENNINNLPLYMDEGMDASRALLVNGIPYTILVDREGREIARILGDRNWAAPEVTALIQQIIQ
jgi:thiol-disulfide isomerase/thioredoxin